MKKGIKKAMQLYELRLWAQGKDNDMDQKRLGSFVYPDSPKESTSQMIKRLVSGEARSIKFEQVDRLCEALGVDANFIFCFPSQYDKEYMRLLVKWQETK